MLMIYIFYIIILLFCIFIKKIASFALNFILQRFFPTISYEKSDNGSFGIKNFQAQNDLVSIEIRELQIRFSFLSIFGFSSKPLIQIDSEYFFISFKSNLNNFVRDKKIEPIISIRSWFFGKIIQSLILRLIKSCGLFFHTIIIEFQRFELQIQIEQFDYLFKRIDSSLLNNICLSNILITYHGVPKICIPEFRGKAGIDINLLELIMIYEFKKICFGVESVEIYFENNRSDIKFSNPVISVLTNSDLRYNIDIKPIQLLLPTISNKFKSVELIANRISWNLDEFRCSKISVINRQKTIVYIQDLSYQEKRFVVPIAIIRLPYTFLMDVALMIQIFYTNEPKLPKALNIPFDLICNSLNFKLNISYQQKVKIQLANGFQFIGTNQFSTHKQMKSETAGLHSSFVLIEKGCCQIYHYELKRYFDCLKISKTEIELLNTKVYKFSANQFDFYVSPMFLYVTYFKIITKCLSYLVSIIKGPQFNQFDAVPPSLIKLTFFVKNVNIFVLKNELVNKVQISNDAKKMGNDDMQLRLRRFYSLLTTMNQKVVNQEELEETSKAVRYKLFRKALRKITKHSKENLYENFATFVMSNVLVDIDGFYFSSKQSILSNFKNNSKFDLLRINNEKIGKINSMKLVIQMDRVEILSNINTKFPQYKICTMKKPSFDCEFHVIEQKPLSYHDLFFNQLILYDEVFEIPMLTAQPLLIYDNMSFIFDKFSVDVMPAILSYYTDSLILIAQIYKKQVSYPDYIGYDKLRYKNIIFGSVIFKKLKINMMIKPNSTFLSLCIFQWQNTIINPLKYFTSFHKLSINLKNKESFMCCPQFQMTVELNSINPLRTNETSFIPVDSDKMLDINHDPFEFSRSRQIDFNVQCAFPTNDSSLEKTKQLLNSELSILFNLDYLHEIIETLLVKHEFKFTAVTALFTKSVIKRNPISMYFNILPFNLPAITMTFMNHIIKLQLTNVFFKNDCNKTIFSLGNIEFWFLKMKEMTLGTLVIKQFMAKFFPGMKNFEIDEFNIELLDKYLINFFFILASSLNYCKNEEKVQSSLSFATKKEKLAWQQRLPQFQSKVIKIDPSISLKDLLDIYNTTFMYVKLNKAAFRFFHRRFIIYPSLSFVNLSIESRSKTSESGRLDILKFEEFRAELLQKEGFPFILIHELELNIMSRKDRLLLQLMLKNGMNMNFQSEAITLATSNLFSNLPKLEQLFNDEMMIKAISKWEEKKLEKKKYEQIRKMKMKQGSEISSSGKNGQNSIQINEDEDNDVTVITMVKDNQSMETTEEVFLDDESMNFACRFYIHIPSNVNIDLIDSDFQTISTLCLEDITYDYLNDVNETIKQAIIVSNFTMFNKLPSAKDQNGNPTRYYKFASPLESVSTTNPFFTMNIHQISHMMKMPFFDNIEIVLLPIELNISKDFIDKLVSNFKLFAEYNIFDFDKMIKDVKIKNQQQDENDLIEEKLAENFSSSDQSSNPHGFYGKVQIEKLKLRMSLLWENAALLKTFENRGLYLEKIVETDLIGTKESIMKLVKKKIYQAIWRSLPSLLASEKT